MIRKHENVTTEKEAFQKIQQILKIKKEDVIYIPSRFKERYLNRQDMTVIWRLLAITRLQQLKTTDCISIRESEVRRQRDEGTEIAL
jgi:hypothetical protein